MKIFLAIFAGTRPLQRRIVFLVEISDFTMQKELGMRLVMPSKVSLFRFLGG